MAQHAKQLNQLKEGVRLSMSEQAKSERLKTELITNVSHDLRTPLTSIITYTDLLKNEDLGDEERRKYVDILDRKSERLKVLIEDVFEVSKMASGNAEIWITGARSFNGSNGIERYRVLLTAIGPLAASTMV